MLARPEGEVRRGVVLAVVVVVAAVVGVAVAEVVSYMHGRLPFCHPASTIDSARLLLTHIVWVAKGE